MGKLEYRVIDNPRDVGLNKAMRKKWKSCEFPKKIFKDIEGETL